MWSENDGEERGGDGVLGDWRIGKRPSPGIERPLKKEKDFARFAGQLVMVKTKESVDPDGRGCERKTFRGELGGMKDGKVSVIQNDKA